MALIREISIGLSVNPRDLVSGLKTAEGRLGQFGKIASGIGSTLAGLEGARLAFDGLKDAVSRATELEKTLAGLSKATDLEGGGLDALKSQLFALSTELKGVRLDDLLAIATTGAKLGIASDGIVEYTRGVAMLSTAMDDIPAEVIADSIGKINVVFKLGVQGALQIGSAIDKLADSGVSSSAGILEVTQRISGMAVATNLSADQTVALAAALLDTGTAAEAGAGALNMLLGAIVRVENHKGFAAAIGISAEEFAAKVKSDPVEAIQLFLKALKGLDAGAQLKVLDSIGINADRGASNIQKLAQQTESFSKYLGMASSEFKTLNQITQSYEKTAATTAATWDQFQNRLDVISETLGSTLLPAVNSTLGMIGEKLDQANNAAKLFIDTLNSIPTPSLPNGMEGPSLTGSLGSGFATGILGPLAPLAGLGLSAVGGSGAATPWQDSDPKAMALAQKKAKARQEQTRTGAVDDTAAFGARALSSEVDDLSKKLDLEIATLGKSSTAIELYKLKQAGATEADIKAVEAKAAMVTELEKQDNANKMAEGLTSQLKEQIIELEKGAEAAEVYRMRMAGVAFTDEDAIKDLMNRRTALQDAKAIIEETRTPLEKYTAEMERLDELLAGGQISQTVYDRKKSALDDGMGGGEPKFAGALMANSTEAYSAQLRFAAQGGDKTDEPIKEVAAKVGETIPLQTRMANALDRIAERKESAGIEMFAF